MAKTTKATTIQFYKTREVESPFISSDSVGIDFYIPYNLTVNELASMQAPRYDDNEPRVQIKADEISGTIIHYVVPPRARLVIPTGIKIKFPEGKSGLLLNKGRIAINTGINVMNSFITNSTTDELKINIVNTSDVPVNITPGKQIAQLIVIDTPLYSLEHVKTAAEFYEQDEIVPTPITSKPDPVESDMKAVESTEPVESVVQESKPAKPVKPAKTAKTPRESQKARLSDEELRRIEEEVERAYTTSDVNAHLNMIGG
jgi:dUTPase